MPEGQGLFYRNIGWFIIKNRPGPVPENYEKNGS
jgi:hypothetical protein